MLTEGLTKAKERDRQVMEELASSKSVNRMMATLSRAKVIGLACKEDKYSRQIYAKEAEVIASFETVASREDLKRLVSEKTIRENVSSSSTKTNDGDKLIFELGSRDKAVKAKLDLAMKLADPRILKDAADEFKRVGLTQADGPLEEAERMLIETPWDHEQNDAKGYV